MRLDWAIYHHLGNFSMHLATFLAQIVGTILKKGSKSFICLIKTTLIIICRHWATFYWNSLVTLWPQPIKNILYSLSFIFVNLGHLARLLTSSSKQASREFLSARFRKKEKTLLAKSIFIGRSLMDICKRLWQLQISWRPPPSEAARAPPRPLSPGLASHPNISPIQSPAKKLFLFLSLSCSLNACFMCCLLFEKALRRIRRTTSS